MHTVLDRNLLAFFRQYHKSVAVTMRVSFAGSGQLFQYLVLILLLADSRGPN